MKIISVSHMFPNRIFPNNGVFVKERLKALSKVVDTSIIAPLPHFPFIPLIKKYKKLDEIPYEEDFDTVYVYHPKYILFPKYFKFIDGYLYYWSMDSFFSKKITNEDIDILDFHWVYPDAFAGLRWAKKYNKKIIVTIRGNESICYFENSLRKKILVSTLQNVDHIIAVSNDMKKKVVKEYGVNDDKVTVIPNGIQPQQFKVLDKKKARMSCSLENNKKYILSLCRLSKEKGLKYLFEAFAELNKKDVELVVVGDGPLKGELSKMAFDLGIANKVKFVGSVLHEETIFWYNAADIYCLPSLWEGCPNVVIESLACGTPVVSTKVGGIPDLVPKEDYGFLVPSGDSRSLTDALDRALEKKWNRELIAQYGSSNTWDNVASEIVKVFQSVLRASLVS